MKIDTLDMAPCRIKMTVKAEADETRPDYKEVLQAYVKNGRVPGFRPGKVPVEMIKKVFEKEIREDVHSRLLRSLYRKAVEEQKLKMVNLVNIEDVSFDPEKGMTASFVIDVQPKFDLPNYKKMPVPLETPSVTDKEVDDYVARIREAFAEFKDSVPGYAAQEKDMVSVDFEGKIAGQPIVDLCAEAKAIASGKDFWTQLDDARFLPELVKALIGMKAGESKEVELTFKGDFYPDAIKDKQAVYTLKLNTIRTRALLDDAALLAKLSVKSLDELRENSKKQLLQNKTDAENHRRENMVVEYLLKKAEFELPESQVSEEVTMTLERMAEDAQRQGVKTEDLERNRNEIMEGATKQAKRQLRLRYLLGAIADELKIEASDADMDGWFTTMASEYRVNPAQLRARVEKNGRLDDLRKQLRDQKTIKALVESLEK